MAFEQTDLPEAANRRLMGAGGGEPNAFSSGLSVPDFAACLELGLVPVGLVQGFCAMRWAWYAAGSAYLRGTTPYSFGRGRASYYVQNYSCPHGYVSSEHRTWGQNYEQPWVEAAWEQGFFSAYKRMMEEAAQAGAHGVVGVVDVVRPLAGMDLVEFHITGTAVALDATPPGHVPLWSTYLAGNRLTKLIEAGFMPVSITAALASVRVWAYCITEIAMEGRFGTGWSWGAPPASEVEQVSSARAAVRRLAREKVRSQLGGDWLHGVTLHCSGRELGEADEVLECVVRGNRVRRFAQMQPLEPPRPTVSLA